MSTETGQLLRLQIPVRARALWIAPVWAVVCGIIASGGFLWAWRDGLIAALALVLADGAWATMWWGLAAIDWPTVRANWNALEVEPISPSLPLAEPGSPAHRSQHWLAHFKAWWPAGGNVQIGSPLLSASFAVVLAVLLSAVIGSGALALTLGALALTQVGLIQSWRGRTAYLACGVLDVGLAWILGHIAFGTLTVPSVVVALLFSVAYAGSLDLAQGGQSTRRWLLAQLGVAVLLVLLQQPIAALAFIAVLIAQGMLSTVLSGLTFARAAQFWMMLAMWLAALGIR